MTIEDLTRRSGAWLSGTGPRSEIVISSRIRLARNLEGYPFLKKATETQRREIERTLCHHILAEMGEEINYFDIDGSEELDRQVLVERHLISRQHAEGEGCRGVAVSKSETVAMMINEEDHLRTQVLRGGLQLNEAWDEINALDTRLSERVGSAFHPRFGYLTACPTNVGTGIRVSVMLHLPALKLTGEIEKVFRAARDMRLAVRGLYGEGTEASGDFFQVSNQTTLGKSESEIIADFQGRVIPAIIDYETEARRVLVEDKSVALDDRVWRAFGVLENARAVSSEETLLLLSHLRMGVNLGRIDRLSVKTVNELFLKTQPAHLQKLTGSRLDGEQRSILRANYIRERLTNGTGKN